MSLLLLFQPFPQSFTLTLSDSVTPSDTTVKVVTSAQSDSATPTDVTAKSVTSVHSDSATPTDSTAKVVSSAQSDSITPADTTTKVVSSAQSDSITPADTTIKVITPNLTETLSPTDAHAAVFDKSLSDTISEPDSVTETKSGSTTKALSDTVTVTDATRLSFTKALTDSSTPSDASPLKTVLKALVDSATSTDTTADTFRKAFSDLVSLLDVIELFPNTVRFSDFIFLSDEGPLVSVVHPQIAGAKVNQQGPVTGNKAITILGGGLDMSSTEDRFSDGTINPALWTTTTSGSGAVVEVAGIPFGVLQLSTGRSPNSNAYLRSLNPELQWDAGIDVELSFTRFANGTAIASTGLGAYVSANTYFRVLVEASKGAERLHILSVVNGVALLDVPVPLTNLKSFNLRIIRNAENVLVFLNKSLILKTLWTNQLASIEMSAKNDSAGAASIVASVAKYTRNPVILFGKEPMVSVLLKSVNRLDGLTPPQDRPGPQTIHVTTSGGTTFDVPEQYLYVPVVDYRKVGTDGTAVLRDTSDPEVRY